VPSWRKPCSQSRLAAEGGDAYRRSREDFYLAHDHPKQLWVRELRPGARTDNWFNRLINLAVINLAGVPSIVHALFGLGAFVYAARFGYSIISASLTLARMYWNLKSLMESALAFLLWLRRHVLS
jgi:hypothetical protein